MTCNMVSVLRHEAALDLLPAGHSIVTETMFFFEIHFEIAVKPISYVNKFDRLSCTDFYFRPGLKVAVVVSCATLVDLTHRFIISVHPALKYK